MERLSICLLYTSAEYATAVTGDNFAAMFAAMDDEYMKARAADVKDISERIVNVLSGNGQNMAEMEEPVILVADDLAPVSYTHLDVYKRQAVVNTHSNGGWTISLSSNTISISATATPLSAPSVVPFANRTPSLMKSSRPSLSLIHISHIPSGEDSD